MKSKFTNFAAFVLLAIGSGVSQPSDKAVPAQAMNVTSQDQSAQAGGDSEQKQDEQNNDSSSKKHKKAKKVKKNKDKKQQEPEPDNSYLF